MVTVSGYFCMMNLVPALKGIFMPLSPDGVSEDIMFLGCPSAMFICWSRQILLPRHLMDGLSNVDKTYREYSLAPTGDLMRF